MKRCPADRTASKDGRDTIANEFSDSSIDAQKNAFGTRVISIRMGGAQLISSHG